MNFYDWKWVHEWIASSWYPVSAQIDTNWLFHGAGSQDGKGWYQLIIGGTHALASECERLIQRNLCLECPVF